MRNLQGCATIMRTLHDCQLYGILDLGYVEDSNAVHVAEAMIKGGVDLIQLRGKKQSIDELRMRDCEIDRQGATRRAPNDHRVLHLQMR